mgnify:CR=1 FL=1
MKKIFTHPLSIISILTLAWFAPILIGFTHRAYGLPGDPSGAIWSFYDSTLHPLTFGLTQPVLLAFEGWVLTHLFGPVAAYNLLSIGAFFLTAWWGYRFFSTLLPRGWALFAALVVAWSPYHVLQSMQHLGIASIQYLMLLLWLLARSWRTPTLASAIMAGVAGALVVLHDYYLALIAGVVLITFSILFIARHRLQGAIHTGINALVAGTLTVPFLWEIVRSVLVSGTIPVNLGLPVREATESAVYSIRAANFVIPPLDHPLIGEVTQVAARVQLLGSNLFEQTFWLGIVALGIAGAMLVLKAPRALRHAKVVAIILIVLGLLFGVSSYNGTHLEPSALAAVIHAVAPVFRVWARFGILVVIGVSILATIGLTRMSHYRTTRVFALLAAGFILIEIFMLPARSFEVSAQSVPGGLGRLAQDRPDAWVAVYPLAPSGEIRDSLYRTWTMFVPIKLWNLESDWNTHALTSEDYVNPFDSRVLARLKSQRVQYLALDLTAYQEGAVPPEILRYYDPIFPNFPLGYPFPTNPIPTELKELTQYSTGTIRIFEIQ